MGYGCRLLSFAVNLKELPKTLFNKKEGKVYPKVVFLGRCYHPWGSKREKKGGGNVTQSCSHCHGGYCWNHHGQNLFGEPREPTLPPKPPRAPHPPATRCCAGCWRTPHRWYQDPTVGAGIRGFLHQLPRFLSLIMSLPWDVCWPLKGQGRKQGYLPSTFQSANSIPHWQKLTEVQWEWQPGEGGLQISLLLRRRERGNWVGESTNK